MRAEAPALQPHESGPGAGSAPRILPGRPSPLGATFDGLGVNFAVYSQNATAVEVCLFDAREPSRQEACIRLPEVTGHVWHGYIRGLRPGQLYGFRAHGPYQPEKGLRFNPAKLLVDPYAKALAGHVDWSYPVFGYPLGNPREDLVPDERDSGPGMPKGVVVDGTFDWRGDAPPRVPWHETVIYEVHVRGATMLHPDVPEAQRGTYQGLASPAMIDHLKGLGVTAVELMPVHAFLNDKHLVDKGLSNYWGYNTLAFFAPEARYASLGDRGEQVAEFKAMVKALHRAGIEVILDVVYNHTAEGNHLGPTLSLRGLDNPAYYRLVPDDPRYYMDYTGTGNSLNGRQPQVLKLIMDSLRYWVQEMHVDGFRFDLASTLARELHDVDRLGSFFDIIHQDPIISSAKLIAEPWDVGPGGYQVGNFPVLWTEWNGKYRDATRAFWKGEEGSMAELALRLTGSSDLYGDDGRRPYASINFVTAHDGFTLRDLASYERKHNEANQEGNRDGHDHNISLNFGVEGETDDEAVLEMRGRHVRDLLATLFLSQGVPMLLAGDEMGRTQGGNNNAYCQDNETSWMNWSLDERQEALLAFTQRVIRLRREHPALRRRKFFQGSAVRGAAGADICWLRPDGQEMGDADWDASWARALMVHLNGAALNDVDPQSGAPLLDDDILILINASDEEVGFTLPSPPEGGWRPVLDTAIPDGEPPETSRKEGAEVSLPARTLRVLLGERSR